MSWQNRVMKRLVLGVLALMAMSAAAPADTVYVNGACGNDRWTGQSEVCAAPDGPKKTIQAGIDAASNDSEVVLADWVYSGLGNTQLDLRMKDIVVRSANGPEACVIDGEFMNRALIVWNQGPLDQDIEGITFRQCHHDSVAGAIYVGSSAIAFKNCVFTENSAEVGGAIQIRAGAKVYFENCFFSENASLVGGGGAVFSAAGAPTEFKPILEYWDSIPWVQFVSCHFDGNDGGLAAGAILVPANVRLTNCVFSHNVTSFIASAVEVTGENATVFGCVFIQNKCEIDGALYSYGNSVITNCTFGMNDGGAIHLSYQSLPLSLKNCIVWGNSPAQLTGWLPGYQVTYSNVQGGWPGDGNIDADPVYVQPASGDLTLGTASPCLDVGLTEALPLDLSDFDDDGDYEELYPYDAAGNPRVQGAAVDMGAYEGEFKALPPQASVLDLGPGEIAFLVPTGGPFNPVESSVAVVTNGSSSTAEVTVTQYAGPVHPFAGAHSELGSTMAMQATLAPGMMLNRMFVSFTVAETAGRDPLSLDLTSFNPTTGNWRLAVEGNSAPSPGHKGPIGDRIAVEGTGLDWGLTTDLGDYGVFWNPSLQKGFVWANLDYAADFAFGTPLCYADCAPPNGDGAVNGIDLQALLAAWGTTGGGIFDINLDGIVNGLDLALLLGTWGACEGGVAPITVPQKVIAPNWGRVVTTSQREVDLDGNGVIDGRDMSLILAAWSGDQSAQAESNAMDLNGDGRVNRDDIDSLLGRR